MRVGSGSFRSTSRGGRQGRVEEKGSIKSRYSRRYIGSQAGQPFLFQVGIQHHRLRGIVNTAQQSTAYENGIGRKEREIGEGGRGNISIITGRWRGAYWVDLFG